MLSIAIFILFSKITQMQGKIWSVLPKIFKALEDSKKKGLRPVVGLKKKGFFLFHIWNSYFNAISTIRDVEGSEKVYGHL